MDPIEKHLEDLSRHHMLPKPHRDYLLNLKCKGFEPRVIYDIGSCVLHWTNYAKQIWPNAHFVLFDAFDKAEFLYHGYDYHMGVLGDKDGKVVKFYQNDINPGGNSYYREIGFDNGSVFPKDQYREYSMMTLDTIIRNKKFPKPDLVKIDVQGAELDIIYGGRKTLRSCRHLIVEMQHTEYNEGAPQAKDTIPFIESLGFKCIAPLFSNNGPDGDYGFVRVKKNIVNTTNHPTFIQTSIINLDRMLRPRMHKFLSIF